MRNAWTTYAAAVSAAALVVLVGCKSTQPDRVQARTASVSLRTSAKVDIYDCYEVWQDQSAPPDGIPDVYTGFNTCDPTPPGPGGGTVVKATRSVPWRYSIEITIIRAGTTNEQVVTSTSGLIGSSIDPGGTIAAFASMTEFDATAESLIDRPHQDDLYFINGKRVSLGNPFYLAFAGIDVGTPNILTQPLTVSPTFDFVVASGDTILVRARKQGVTDAPPFIHFDQDPEITLEGTLSVGGQAVTTNGVPSSSILDKSGFSVSYTVP
jgi:hypothetical protein